MKPFLKKVLRRRSSSRSRSQQELESNDNETRTQAQSESESETRSASIASRGSRPRHDAPTGQFGLRNLDVPELDHSQLARAYDIDVVAIHGLNGDLEQTWTHANGTYWLKDLLPGTLPGCRVFSYGYPSKIFFNPSSGDIRHYAQNLLASVRRVRRQDTKLRPIIYICHSLGGIVFKEAMNIAFERFPEVWTWSKGVVFLGTPHRGSGIAEMATILGNIANAAFYSTGGRLFNKGVNTTLLQNLTRNSSQLNSIGSVFTKRAVALKIVTFYETFETQGAGTIIVGENSAVIGVSDEDTVAMYSDHRNLCRFESKHAPNYELVADSLMDMAGAILDEKKDHGSSIDTGRSLGESDVACVKELNTLDIAAVETGMDQRVDGTLLWILDNPQYTTWLADREARLLMVTGYAGCGKTILSYYIVQLLANQSSHSVVCRFFCDGKVQAQQEGVVLLQNVIYQIVKHRRNLLRLVKKAAKLQGFHLFGRFDALWDLLVEITRNEKPDSIIVIIDAIDECDDKTQRLIMSRIIRMITSDGVPSVKFFITSRPNTPAVHLLNSSSATSVRLSLEEQQDIINKDIHLVIRQRLESLVACGKCEEPTQHKLEDMLVAKADSTFLWVSLNLKWLEDRLHVQPSEVDKLVQKLPPNLPLTYQRNLEAIPRDDIDLASKLLRILAVKARPLTVDEISILLSIRPSHRKITMLDVDRSRFRLGSIQTILGSLIKVIDSRVDLIHQSVKDYMIDLSTDQSNPLSADFGIDLQNESLKLAQSCIYYLGLDDFKTDIFTAEHFAPTDSPASSIAPLSERIPSDEPSLFFFNLQDDHLFREPYLVEAEMCTAIATRYPLFDYASTYWATHFSQGNDKSSPETHDDAIRLCERGSSHLDNWFRYFWVSNSPHEPLPRVVDPFVIAAYFGQQSTLRQLLGGKDQSMLGRPGAALYWAARRGNISCLEMLLSEPKLELADCHINDQFPLATASKYGHVECVKALLESGRFDINEVGIGHCTALYLACEGGVDHTAAVLLSSKNIDVNLTDRTKATPLMGAVKANAVKTVLLLLADSRVDPNSVDNKGRDALSYAAEEGHAPEEGNPEIFKAVLRHRQIDLESTGPDGVTPLMYAAHKGHLDVVQQLVRRANVLARDKHGRNAISWASNQRKPSVLRYLLRKDPNGIDITDRDGWAPLAWALDQGGYPDNVAILLQSGRVDVNRKDSLYGSTILTLAIGYKETKIAQMLLQTEGIDPDLQDGRGRFPLSMAARHGNLPIVRDLLDSGRVDVNAKDSSGRTALFWAASEGHVEVTTLLLAVPGADVNSRDREGRAPIDLARDCEWHEVVLLLEQAGR